MSKPTIIDLRAKAKADLAVWYDETVCKPFVDKCRKQGMPDDEINILFNLAMQPYMAWNENRGCNKI